MKKLPNLKGAKTLNKIEQKAISGGFGEPCPCTTNYTEEPGGGDFCSYPAKFPQGFVCYGTIEFGMCCVNH